MKNEKLLEQLQALVKEADHAEDAMHRVCVVLDAEFDHYDWTGFYLVDPEAERELILGPFVGEPTEHTRIAFGQGICGQAADTEMPFIIQDVTKETNYLSCSPHVKSEIVIPMFKDGKVVGELDIDSHLVAPFSDEDRAFLEAVCEIVAARM